MSTVPESRIAGTGKSSELTAVVPLDVVTEIEVQATPMELKSPVSLVISLVCNLDTLVSSKTLELHLLVNLDRKNGKVPGPFGFIKPSE